MVDLLPRWLAFSRAFTDEHFGPIWEFAYRVNIGRRYNEPHRKFHTLEHIASMLREFNKPSVRRLAKYPYAVEAAIWYHDVIYRAGSDTNEEQSAHLAKSELLALGCAEEFCAEVAHLILWTKHKSIPKDPDAKLLVSIDLLTLSAPTDVFWENTRKIREEWRDVIPNDIDFLKGQAIFLGNLFKRKAIYPTEYYCKRYEKRARKNIEWLIDRAGHDSKFR